jgi:TPR repeat protein
VVTVARRWAGLMAWWLFAVCLLGCAADGAPARDAAAPAVVGAERMARTAVAARAARRRWSRMAYDACRGGRLDLCVRLGKRFERGSAPMPPARRTAALFERVCGAPYPPDGTACMAASLYARACDGGHGAGCLALARLVEAQKLGPAGDARAQHYRGRACASGLAASCTALGRRYLDGRRSTPRSRTRAARLFTRACDAGDAAGCLELGRLHARGFGASLDAARAAQLFDQACRQGDPVGCHELAARARMGLGVAHDVARATELWRKACDAGVAASCEALGRVLDVSSAAKQKQAARDAFKRAAGGYRAACRDGARMRACGQLGGLLREGLGVVIDPERGLELQQRACRGGDARACIAWMTRGNKLSLPGREPRAASVLALACEANLGAACYLVGRLGAAPLRAMGAEPAARPFVRGCRAGHGGSCNRVALGRGYPPSERNRQLLSRGCDLGDAPSCFHLAVTLQLPGAGQPEARALELLERSCRWSYGLACERLGQLLSRGGGGAPMDIARAEVLLHRACRLGAGDACGELGVLLHEGTRVAPDRARGLALLERGCRLRSASACARHGRILEASADPAVRERGVMQTKEGCRGGSVEACLQRRRALRDADDKLRRIARAAVARASDRSGARCERSLTLCYQQQPGEVRLGWRRWRGAPAYAMVEPPACGQQLESLCSSATLGLDASCRDGDAARCSAASRLQRSLARHGIGRGEQSAASFERSAFELHGNGCRAGRAADCQQLSDDHRRGRGTKVSEPRARRAAQRACRLDARYCAAPSGRAP